MLKIAICDDDPYYREQTTSVVKEYASSNRSKNISISTFSNAEDLLDAVSKNGGFDIYMLDIIMAGMNAIELGKALREKGFDEKIVYLTTSDEYAVSSYSVNASDYILKPASDELITATLDKLTLSVSDRKEKSFLVKTKDGSIKLNFDNILYAELVKRCIVYHLKDGRMLESISVRTNFADTVKELVSDKRFVMCGKSRLLNMHQITEVGNENVVFNEQKKLSLGKKLCREVHNTWLDFNFSEVSDI